MHEDLNTDIFSSLASCALQLLSILYVVFNISGSCFKDN